PRASGEHASRDRTIIEVLHLADEPISRPANLSGKAPGRGVIRIAAATQAGCARDMYVITVLGRLFINLPADDPFATVDRLLATLPESNPLVVVEAHMEATSEKT